MSAKKSPKQLDAEIAAALAKPPRKTAKLKPKKSAYDQQEALRIKRLKWLRTSMEEEGEAWRDTDLNEIDGWIDVDEELPNSEWLDVARKQLMDENILPENAGAPPPNVYLWNDVFISTYRMNIDGGMSRQDAIDSARQNAHDTVPLHPSEHGLTKTDPKLYEEE